MDFRDLQQFVLGYGFKEANRSAAQTWINYQWGRIWAEHAWTFKDVGPTNLTVTASDDTPTMPSDFAAVTALQNQNGDTLSPLAMDVFDRSYQPMKQNGTTGPPEAFKVVNFQVVLGPVPDTTETFTLAYTRRVGYHPAGDTSLFTVGLMAADTDVPAFLPVEHHPWIGMRAARSLLRQLGDPAWANFEDEITEAEQLALNDLLPEDGGEPGQYGRDTWGL